MSHKSITLAKPVCNSIQRKKYYNFSLIGIKSYTYQKYRSQKGCYESDFQRWVLYRRQISQGGPQILRGRTLDGWPERKRVEGLLAELRSF